MQRFNYSMAAATAAAGMSAAALAGRRFAVGLGGSERGKLLGQFRRAAMRTSGVFPFNRADENFAVAPALFTMKFVNRHDKKIISSAKGSSTGKMNKEGRNQGKNSSCIPAFLIQTLILHGDNLSRCGRWSRFQRDKAASLVSAKRNRSVGDSTWPSQKTTLALP